MNIKLSMAKGMIGVNRHGGGDPDFVAGCAMGWPRSMPAA
jgi:hypothetical protein